MDDPDLTAQLGAMDELTAIQQMLAEQPPAPHVVEAARAKLARVTLDGTGAVPPHGPPGAPWPQPAGLRRGGAGHGGRRR